MQKKIHQLVLLGLDLIWFYMLLRLFKMDQWFIYRYACIFVMFNGVFGHYSMNSYLIWDELKVLVKSHLCLLVAMLILTIPEMTWHTLLYTIKMIIMCLILGMGTLLISRYYSIYIYKTDARRVLVIGTDRVASDLRKIYQGNRFAKSKVVGYIDVNECSQLPYLSQLVEIEDDLPIYRFDDIDKAIRALEVSDIIIDLPQAHQRHMNVIVDQIKGKVKSVKFVPATNTLVTYNTRIEECDDILLISSVNASESIFGRILKRGLDILAGLAGCLLLVPLSMFVKHKNKQNGDQDPVFFTQERIGKDGKPILIYKYRSMVPHAEEILEELMEKDPKIKEEYLIHKKLAHDPRVTPVGAFLRKSSLDEFPQFINVLKGEMSLIGPRPYLPREKGDMGNYYDEIIKMKPGITGMWQANGRSDVEFEDRLKLDDYYYRNWSIWLDMTILMKTVKAVLYGKGAR